ncbi:hypothetical protein RhiirC2_795841 [Rhizophagus irregularis]|uniref:DUF659 domain-containing protein n=1 Tax=Rhizophagus irregularis TaxID=588596 RepID=A0A2N1MAR4_9GLOM|nr:hypothetical protein RhiirC2_795841 [Rhizophagus irregularis]
MDIKDTSFLGIDETGIYIQTDRNTSFLGHIANHYSNVPPHLIQNYQKVFEEKANNNNKKRKFSNQTSLYDYHDADELLQRRIDRINKALLKFFIEDVINRVGVSKFSAIVSDNGSNVRKALQHPFADKLLKKVNILVTFFRNNTRAGKNILNLNVIIYFITWLLIGI